MEGFKPTSEMVRLVSSAVPADCREWRSVNMRRPLRIEGGNVMEGSGDEDGGERMGLTAEEWEKRLERLCVCV